MTAAYAQNPAAMRADWSRYYAATRRTRVSERAGYFFAAIAVMLGFVSGFATEAITWNVLSAKGTRYSASASSSATGVNGHKVAPPEQAQVRENQPGSSTNAVVASSVLPTGRISVTQDASRMREQHAAPKLLARNSTGAKQSTPARPTLPVYPIAPASRLSSGASEDAGFSAAPPSSFFIEGDVTVADYDIAEGMITTSEGMTFAVNRIVDENNAMSLQDYPAHVHYRCDQTKTCTLMHAGVVTFNARRTT